MITYERELIAEPEEEMIPLPISAKSVDIAKDKKSSTPLARATRAIQSLRAAAKSPPAPEKSSSMDSATNSEGPNNLNPTVAPTSPSKVITANMFPAFGHGDSFGVVNQIKYRLNEQVCLSVCLPYPLWYDMVTRR